VHPLKWLWRQCSGKYAPAFLLAVAGTVFLAIRWLAARPLWLDEEMIALSIRERGLLQLPGALWLGQSAPLGWLVVERVAIVAFGAGERSLRALPVACGAAAIWAALWVGRRSMGAVGAAIFVFLCAFSVWATYHALELKPYSADLCFGLVVPALAAWTLDAPDEARFRARTWRWWIAAGVAQSLANGALLVTPACAAVLAAAARRRRGWRGMAGQIGPAACWLALFALHYGLATRFALGSRYLHDYWAFALPPPGSTIGARLAWLGAQFQPFAVKPGGSDAPLVFWVTAGLGLALALRRNGLGVFAAIPVCGFLFAGIGVVPLFERLSLWMLPALYLGMALLGDASAGLLVRCVSRRRFALLVPALAGAALTVLTLAGVGRLLDREHLLLAPGGGNHALDDRAAMKWLMARHEPGDVLFTTHLAEPAVWWYGDVPIADPDRGRHQRDGSPIMEVDANAPVATCDASGLQRALAGHRRALVFLGFRFDDQPRALDDLLLWRLADFGEMTAYRGFGPWSRVAVFDLTQAPRPRRTDAIRPDARPDDPAIPRNICLGVGPAERW
jgi:hypothetical protein